MKFTKIMLAPILCWFLTAPAAARAASAVDYVDPMIGVRGPGSCVPGPCLPHGSIHPSPDTLRPGNGGYRFKNGGGIVGFSQLHAQGTGGNKSYGNFLISPQIGLAIVESEHASEITDEQAHADSYRARLSKYGILCEVTPVAHAAIYRFTFPKSDEATIAIDAARKLDSAAALDEGSVTIDPATGTITGGGHFSHNWNPAPYTCYFAIEVSRKPDRVGTWIDHTIQKDAGSATAHGQPLGAYLQWQTEADETIYLKIAVSFVSESRAAEYLHSELPGWDFAAIQAQTKLRWEKALSAIEISGASDDQQRMFYTALYHALIQPRDRTGDNPNWKSDAPFWDDQYTLWDMWRTLYPLMAIVDPPMVRDVVNSFLDRHQHNGYVGTGFVQGKEYKLGQGGDDVDNVIADACVKEVPGIDWQQAYAVLKSNADRARTKNYLESGWVSIEDPYVDRRRMKSASGTLAFSYNDFCVAQVARKLDKTGDYQKYLARSANWKNVWDDSLADAEFNGFPRARHADGKFAPTAATAGYNTDFYEGTCWIYSYFVPQDVPGMIQRMGGREIFIRRLQYALEHNLIDFTNEPSFYTIWWFSAVGRPDLAGYWAAKLYSQYTTDGYPGDEDSGAMSSLYVFVTAGFFPIGGQDIYYLHGARVPKMAFHLSDGKTFTVIGRNTSDTNVYVQSATLNGAPLVKPLITHEQILAGGTLEFVMGGSPRDWGQPLSDAPSSAKSSSLLHPSMLHTVDDLERMKGNLKENNES